MTIFGSGRFALVWLLAFAAAGCLHFDRGIPQAEGRTAIMT